MKKLYITGVKEDKILKQILAMEPDLELLRKILNDYEKSTGLDSLKKNMGLYFEVI